MFCTVRPEDQNVERCTRLDRNVGNHPSTLARDTTRQDHKGLRTLLNSLSCGTSQMTRLSSFAHSVRQPKPPGCTSHFLPALVEFCSKTQMIGHISAVGDSVDESRATDISQRPKPSGFQASRQTLLHVCPALYCCRVLATYWERIVGDHW